MQKKDIKIVFMGTPDFAVESLKKLTENNFNIVGVVTSPDKPAGRGQKIRTSSVKKYALDNNLRILQPLNLKNPSFLKELKELDPDIQIIVAFRMLPKSIWSIPKYGTFNLHSSLLPDYRGAAPINWAIINGEKKTGVSTFFINEEIDTGDILLQKEVNITKEMNAGELHNVLMNVGADLVIETLNKITEKNILPIKQYNLNLNNIKPAPKIFKNDCKINLEDTIENIYNKIRGLNPLPGAWCNTIIDNKEYVLKIFDTSIISTKEQSKNDYNNFYIYNDDNNLIIKLNDGLLKVQSLQLSSKNKMNAKDFINGILKSYKNLVIT